MLYFLIKLIFYIRLSTHWCFVNNKMKYSIYNSVYIILIVYFSQPLWALFKQDMKSSFLRTATDINPSIRYWKVIIILRFKLSLLSLGLIRVYTLEEVLRVKDTGSDLALIRIREPCRLWSVDRWIDYK